MLPQQTTNLNSFLLRLALSALGLWFATGLINGLRIDGPLTLLLAAVLLGACNAVVRPLLILLTLPATMLSLVAWMLPGFAIDGFWPAFFGSIVVGLTGWVGSMLFR